MLTKYILNSITMTTKKPLTFNILAECKSSKARVSKMVLPHGEVDTPVFMPVGTQVFIRRLKRACRTLLHPSHHATGHVEGPAARAARKTGHPNTASQHVPLGHQTGNQYNLYQNRT